MLVPFFAPLLHAASAGDVVINEIMYDPGGSDTGHEWVEIYNKSGAAIDLTGWKFRESGTNHGLTFTQGGSIIPAGGFAVLADNATTFLADYTSNAAVSGGMVLDTTFSLSQSGESLALLDSGLVEISSLAYSGASPWPTHIEGQSIGRLSLTGDDNDPANWALEPSSGTPDAANLGTSGGGSGGGGGGGVEVCNDGVDNNGDGLVDCNDTQCAVSPFCAGPTLRSTTAKTLEVDKAHDPFSPYDWDPNFKSARILFNMRSAGVVKTIRIINMRGDMVRLLVNGDVGSDGTNYAGVAEGVAVWDGRDDSGNVAPLGIYIVFLEGSDPASGDSIRAKDTVTLGRPF